METRYLKTLLAVLESGSFSRTATDLNITQSAVSQRIKCMEEQYGTSLIDRTGPVIVATAAGDTVVRKARQILTLEMELADELKGLTTTVPLAICCTPTFGIVYLPVVLSRFFLATSDTVKFKSSLNTPHRALKGMEAHEFDLAVIEHCTVMDTSGFVSIPLPEDELTLISSPSLGLSGREISLGELLDQRLIARREGCSSRCLLEENLARFGKRLDDFRGMVVHEDLYLSIQTALAGQGVAFVSRSLVRQHLMRGELLEHVVDGFTCYRSRTLVMNRRRSEEGFIRDFVDCIHGLFDQGHQVLQPAATAYLSPAALP